ncbi:MAG: hypothetical protein HQ518_25670 [Rhodopirellula sp.]|nr:hypothetical protein [Rhodopirellula sp.]
MANADQSRFESGSTLLRPIPADLEIIRATSPAIAEIIDGTDDDDAQSVIHSGRCVGDWHDRLAMSEREEPAPQRGELIRALRRVYAVLAAHQNELIEC